MNKEQTKEAIAIMQAWTDGKPVQCRQAYAGLWVDINSPCTSVAWDWKNWEYRIKPEVVRYRRAVTRGANKPYIVLATSDSDVRALLGSATFVRWIDNDWIEEIV